MQTEQRTRKVKEEVKYTIEQANKTERFISIKNCKHGINQIHIYRYDKKQLHLVATAFTENLGYNTVVFHDEAPFKN
jgi:hypothetical protein